MSVYSFLNEREAKTLSAIARRVLALNPDENEKNVVAHVDAFLSEKDGKTKKTFHLLFFGFEYLPFLFYLKPFSKLPQTAQEKYLSFWENAPVKKFRTGFFGFKTLSLLGYYTDESCWKGIGYEGPLLTEERPRAHDV